MIDGARIGALAKMSHVADHGQSRAAFPAVFGIAVAGASAQLRNMATIGGNHAADPLFFFATPAPFPPATSAIPAPGARLGGITRNHAVLGTSEACIATYPGDLAVALGC